MKKQTWKWIMLGAMGAAGMACGAFSVLTWQGQKTSLPKPVMGEAVPGSKSTGAVGQTRAQEAPDAALAAALTETDATHREELLEQWAQSVAVSDLGAALEENQSTPDPKWKSEIRRALLISWGRRDLGGAVKWFGQRNAADSLHDEAREVLGQAMAGREPAAMAVWMEKALPASSRDELYWPFFRQWASRDPAAAAGLALQLGQSSARTSDSTWTDLVGQVASQWADADVNRAVNWVQTLPEGAARAQALVQVSRRWAQADPHAAAVYAAGPLGNSRLIGNVAGAWAENDPRAAADWGRSLPGGQAGNALASVVAVWSQTDPKASLEFVASLPSGEVQNRAALAAVAVWASAQPGQAAQWAGQLPEDSMRGQLLQKVATTWAESDLGATARWLQDLPGTPSRDLAVDAYSTILAQTKPDGAFQWAEKISNETMRNRELQDVGKIWLQEDPSDAQQKIAQSNLPQGVKDQLLSTAAP